MSNGFQLGRYRHYKGGYYSAIGLAAHHETQAQVVIYVSHSTGLVRVRPLVGWAEDPDAWLGYVTVNGERVQRFAYVGEE